MDLDAASNTVSLSPEGSAPERRQKRVIHPPSFSFSGLLSNLANLVQYRDLILTLSEHRIKVRYKQSLLGITWALFLPLSLMFIYTFIFSMMAKVPSNGVPYPVFVYAALLPWTSFSTAMSNGTVSLVTNSSLITKVYFPREILPITNIIAAVFDFLIASIILVGLMIYYHVPLTLNALYALPIFILQLFLVLAVILFLSATNVLFRDIGLALPLLLQLWMFASPVAYPLSSVPARFRFLYELNPMVGVIENFRRVLIQGAPPDYHLLGITFLLTVIALPLAYVYFKQVEATAVDVI
jgi:lipopolysaccharide transport system permease protein